MAVRATERKALPVLLVEDNLADARLVQEMLERTPEPAFRIQHVNRLAEALQRVNASDPDCGCILLDLRLPDADGLEAIAQIRVYAPDIPIIVLSGMADEFLAVQAVNQGAQDYLIKGNVDEKGLRRSIRYGIERKRAEADLAYRAMHDGLTNLPNMALFVDRLTLALNRLSRHPCTMAVMFLDLDRFKSVNDVYGHTVGSKLLVEVAKRLQSGLRITDTVARYGGDEFVILCEDLEDPHEAELIAERLQQVVGEPAAIGGTIFSPTASLGVVLPEPDDDPDDVLRMADVAMYRAKEAGRAQFAMFDETMRSQMSRDGRAGT